MGRLGSYTALLIIVVVPIGDLHISGAISSVFPGAKPAIKTNLPESGSQIQSDAHGATSPCEFDSATPEQQLKARLSGIEIANKNADPGYKFSLTGRKHDILKIKAPLESYSRDNARRDAESFINAMIEGENLDMLICTGVVSIIVTDGKRTWTKILKTGNLIQSN